MEAFREPRLGDNIVVRDELHPVNGLTQFPALITQIHGTNIVSARVSTESGEYTINSVSKQGTPEASPGRNWRFVEDEETEN